MAELVYFTGPMNCGKSTLALQVDYTEASAGRRGLRFSSLDRGGEATITSRIGLARPATEVGVLFEFWGHVVGELTAGRRVDYLVCDEAQFYTEAQVDDLARIVDELGIDAYCFGILTDFRTRLFPASARLVELADRIEILQARPRCWCGARATHNARLVDGVMVTTGEQIAVGDTDGTDGQIAITSATDGTDGQIANGDTARLARVSYEVLCRRHHRLHEPASVGGVVLTPEPLPFGDPDSPHP